MLCNAHGGAPKEPIICLAKMLDQWNSSKLGKNYGISYRKNLKVVVEVVPVVYFVADSAKKKHIYFVGNATQQVHPVRLPETKQNQRNIYLMCYMY